MADLQQLMLYLDHIADDMLNSNRKRDSYLSPTAKHEDEDGSETPRILDSIKRSSCRLTQSIDIARHLHQNYLEVYNKFKEAKVANLQMKDELHDSITQQNELQDTVQVLEKAVHETKMELQERENGVKMYS